MPSSPYRARRINPEKTALARHLRRSMTPTEKKLWSSLRANRLDGLHFRRQIVVEGYIADFYCHAARLVVEVDGGVHQQQQGYDGLRDQVMKAAGYAVLRIPAEEVESNVEHVLTKIRKAVARQ